MSSNGIFKVDYPKLVSLAAAGQLIPGRDYRVSANPTDPGWPFRAVTNSEFVNLNGQMHTKLGYDGLVIGASGDGRNYAVTNLQSNTISITAGVITFFSISAYPMRKGHKIRIGANNFPQIEGEATVITAVPQSGGTLVTATMNPALGLADVAQGTITGSDITMGDMQCLSTTAGYVSMIQILSGGRLNMKVFGTSGSIIQDWLAPARITQVRSVGRLPFLIIGIGVSGNALNANAQSGDHAADALEQLIQLHAGQFDKIYVGDVSCLSDEFGDGSGAGGRNTSTYAAGQRYLNRLDELTTKYPHVARVECNSYEVTVDTGTDTQAGLNGFCAVTAKHDDGVHPLWDAAWAEACAYWDQIRHDFPFRKAGALVKPFSVLQSPTVDPDGKQVQNIVEPLYGTVAATGGIPNSYTGSAAGVNGMTVANRVEASVLGGSEWRTYISSGGNTGVATTQFSQIYTGTANSLLTQLNRSAARGVPITIIWDGGIYGFNELMMSFVELVLEVDTGDGQGLLELAAGLSENGLYNAAGSVYTTGAFAGQRGAQTYGWWGQCRFPTFVIDPTLPNFTAAQIRQTARPRNGFDPGNFVMRMGPRSIIKPAW